MPAKSSKSQSGPPGRGITLSRLAAVVDSIAPESLAYDWDNVGLQLGDATAELSRVAVGLEVTDGLIQFAVANGCQALVTHHPLIFRPLKSLTSKDPAQRRLLDLAARNIGLIAAHTNLDRVVQGTNGILARRMGLENLAILDPTPYPEQFKVVVFVPGEYTAKLIDALHRAGAGRIGAYSKCTFRTSGTGTFEGDAGSNPFFGESGRLEQVAEERLEFVVPASRLDAVMAELRAAHPYEEMAADVFALRDWRGGYGLGVVGEYPGPRRPVADVATDLIKAASAEFLQQVGPRPPKGVRRVGVLTGSPGPSLLAAREAGVDLLVTGEMGYHAAVEAADLGMCILLCGHAASERVFAREFSKLLADGLGENESVEFLPFEDYPEPFRLILPG